MTPDRFIACQGVLGMSDSQLIRILDVDDRRFRRWKSGERVIPANVETWLEALVRHWADNPPPKLRGTRRELAVDL